MLIRHELKYDAPAAEVYAMLADPAFRERVCHAQRATTCTVDVDPSGSAMSVVVDQTRPSEGIPGFARKIVGDEIRIVQKEDWQDPTGARLHVTIPGKPGELTGTIRLDGDDSATVETIEGDLKVSIPLISGKLEKLIAEMLDEALQQEQKVARAWLADR
jgi:uncharacterized protein YndB with AHSA1/START domain